ncbi:hypothetical protein ACTQ6A_07635 [Lachnospiraceae bacterium LCP25S3_G4]
MNLIGKRVTHTKYGTGKIIAVYKNKMEVDFTSVVKPFLYPGSFEKHFTIEDKQAKKFIHERIEEINNTKMLEKQKREKEIHLRTYARKAKIKVNSHAVFAVEEDNIEEILGEWAVFSGNYRSGKAKGKPRIPKNLHMNSACLLTTKPKEGNEEERIVRGLFMVKEDFKGADCETGIVPAHKNHRIMWELERETLWFWNYFSKDSRLEKWGNSEMKYLPNIIIKKILEHMIALTTKDEKQKEILEFYDYYCQINHM